MSNKPTKKTANTQGKGRKIAIISLICASLVLVVAAICIGALSGLGDVPENSSSSATWDEGGDWTGNY